MKHGVEGLMSRSYRWRVLALVASVGLAVTAVAFGGAPARDGGAAQSHGSGVGHHFHPRVGRLLGLEPSVTPQGAGTMLLGGEIITHFQGGRGAKRLRGTGGGRMIYTGTEALEPTLGIDKKGNIFYQGGGSTAIDTPVGVARVPKPTVVVSRDGGRSWDEVTPATHPHTQDPFLYVDTRTGRAFTADLTFPCTSVSHSDDVGQSWTTSQACGLTDHQNLSAGPPVSSSTDGYPLVVYMCAIDLGDGPASLATSCLKSLDGGMTWARTGAPAFTADPTQDGGLYGVPGMCEGGSGHSFVDSKGILYVPRGWCGQPYLAISKDEGATWERIQVADNGMPQGMDRVCAGSCTDMPYYDHEAAVAVDDKDNIYYFWTARNRLPYLAISTDKGKSFSKPIMVGPPGLKEAWGPTMDIGATGRIALAYVGSINAPGGKSPDGAGEEYDAFVTWNGYITTSVDALSKRPRFFTASVNPRSDPIMRGECGVVRCGAQFDFIDIVIGPDGRPWTSMVDDCPSPGKKCDPPGFGLGFVGTVIGGPKLR